MSLINISWKVDNETRMKQIIQIEYLYAGKTIILIFIALGSGAGVTCCILCTGLRGMMIPLDNTVLIYRSLKLSLLILVIELKTIPNMPQDSMPRKEG